MNGDQLMGWREKVCTCICRGSPKMCGSLDLTGVYNTGCSGAIKLVLHVPSSSQAGNPGRCCYCYCVHTCMSCKMKTHVFALLEDRGKGGMGCPAPFPIGDPPSKPNANDVLDVWHSLHIIAAFLILPMFRYPFLFFYHTFLFSLPNK